MQVGVQVGVGRRLRRLATLPVPLANVACVHTTCAYDGNCVVHAHHETTRAITCACVVLCWVCRTRNYVVQQPVPASAPWRQWFRTQPARLV